MTAQPSLKETLQEVERQQIIDALKAAGGNKLLAARRLNISRGTLYRRLRVYGLERLIRDPLDGLK